MSSILGNKLKEIVVVYAAAAAFIRGNRLVLRQILGTDALSVTIDNDDLTLKNLGAIGFGEIYTKDNTDQVTLNSAAKVQVTDFDADGEAFNMTPVHAEDHIVVGVTGTFLVTVSVAVINMAGAGHKLSLAVFKNNGATEFNNLHAHRNLASGTDIGSMSLSGIITAVADDTLELWANTDSGSDRNVIFEDVAFSVVQIK